MTSQRTRDRLVQRLRDRGISHPEVLAAIGSIPRHEFVDEALSTRAYEDTALPIGLGQTISQPYVVALMTEALLSEGKPEMVLEIGTGSGYQAAILSMLVKQVYSVERIGELARQARRLFRQLGMRNIRAKQSDGHVGWAEHAPYPAIIVTAAGAVTPEALLDQLDEGGILVAPVGRPEGQRLLKYTRRGDDFDQQDMGAVSFVPLLPGVR